LPLRVNSAEFILSATAESDFITDQRPQFAFAGRSNVGKSSLINRLLQRKGLARTSSTPGRTRAVNYFLINDRFYCVDLPGYGYAKTSKQERATWGTLVESYLGSASGRLKLVLLVDGKISGSPLDAEAFAYFSSFGLRPIVAVTKIDKVPRNNRPSNLAAIARLLEVTEEVRILPVSSQTGEGLGELWKELLPA
jgi:GTP-binding protein